MRIDINSIIDHQTRQSGRARAVPYDYRVGFPFLCISLFAELTRILHSGNEITSVPDSIADLIQSSTKLELQWLW